MFCGSCSDGYVFASFAIEGGTRYQRVRCACNPEPEVQRSTTRKSPRFNLRHMHRAHAADYREDLARFPNDPEARVSGERDLKRLIDKRRRDGWIVGEKTLADVANTKPPEMKSGEQIAREAYEAARAKNFEPEA